MSWGDIMWLRNYIGRNLRRAKSLATQARRFCLGASVRGGVESDARLDDWALVPRLREFVAERRNSLQQRLDRINRALAERAVPKDRRDRVKQLSHEPAHPGRRSLHVVRPESDAIQINSSSTPTASPRRRPGSSTQLSSIKHPVRCGSGEAAGGPTGSRAVPARRKPALGAGPAKPSTRPGKPNRSRASLKT